MMLCRLQTRQIIVRVQTFRLKTTSDAGLYGQRTYSVGDLLSGEVVGELHDYTRRKDSF
jgi:hypothetical protein